MPQGWKGTSFGQAGQTIVFVGPEDIGSLLVVLASLGAAG